MAPWLVPSRVLDILRVPGAVEILHHLGYAAYVGVILGVGKLLAIRAILTPQTRLLRERAYAEMTFDLIGAFISHMVAHDPLRIAFTPLLVLGLAAACAGTGRGELLAQSRQPAVAISVILSRRWHHARAMI